MDIFTLSKSIANDRSAYSYGEILNLTEFIQEPSKLNLTKG